MKTTTSIKAICGSLVLVGILLLGSNRALAINTVVDYQKSPAFVTSPVQPLTMLMLDNSGSMGFDAYPGTYDATKKYYGLFDTHTEGSASADVYYYHPFNITGSGNVCNYTGIEGTCDKPGITTTGTCSYPTRTCSTGGGGSQYTCFRPSGTLTEFNNNDCDGPDSNTDEDCVNNSDCDSHSRTTYTCRTKVNDVTDGNFYRGPDGNRCLGNCSGDFSCASAYVCENATSGPVYGEDRCDANNDGNKDCSSGNDCIRKKISGDRQYTCANPGGNEDSGSYTTSNCDSSCNPGASCVSLGNTTYWTCNARESGTGDDYSTATCDGSDANTATDCSSGYGCVTAYQCTKPGETTKYFPTSDCSTYKDLTGSDVRCRTSLGWTCSSTASGSVDDWTGKTCASCESIGGVCTNTGTITDASYDCLANPTNIAKCAAFADSVCTPSGAVDTCDWTDLVQKAVCQALCGGILIDTPTGERQAGCATAAEQADCINKYGSVCEPATTYSTDRAPYWTKTPADATHALGWNCNTVDCLGSGANVTLGNRLNFDQMTQMDVAKKVLIGGKRTTSIGGRVQLDGDFSQTSTQYFCSTNGNYYSSSSNCRNATGCSSSTCSSVTTGNNGNILLQAGEDPKGLLQNNEGLAWGFGVFNNPDGGKILNYIGSPNADIVKSINDTPSSGWTPLAESLNTVVNYFRQVPEEYHLNTGIEYTRNAVWDPFIDNASLSYAPCGRASTILITDGEPTADDKFNATIKNYANNNSSGIQNFTVPPQSSYYECNTGGGYFMYPWCDNTNLTLTTCLNGSVCKSSTTTSSTNSYYLDDVAYWPHTNDLRTEPQMGGPQTMDTYMIYAFGNDLRSMSSMQRSAVLGAFTDKNNDGKPNSPTAEQAATDDMREWDFNKDGIPDNYAAASDGEALASRLQNMLGQIQQKVSAGSAASVISASRSGEGAIYQAIFYPKTPPDAAYRKVTWVGDVHALWLDDYGNMREDCDISDTGDACTGADARLNTKTDKIIEFYSDATTGEAMIRTFRDTNGDSRYISGTCSLDIVKNGTTVPAGNTSLEASKSIREFDCTSMGGIWDPAASPDFVSTDTMKDFSHYLWSGGRWLADAAATPQRAYTSTAKQRHILTMEKIPPHFDDIYTFDTTTMRGYYGTPGYRNIFNAASDAEADNILNYVRGVDIPAYRSRLYDWGWGDGAKVNKLGDIVGSTPTIVAKPAEDYDVIYADKSYQRFRQKYDNRRVMVYAGGNDGGLHAFNGGYYNRADKQFLNGPPGKVQYDLGAEMWMYVPQSLLPHLKWLTDPNYNHVYYVDMKPYVFDAKIFTPDADHPDGWGTVLVGGMGFGGGDFTVDIDGDGIRETTLRPTYFILDITNPERPPILLKEFSDPNMGFSLGSPTAVPMLRCDRRLPGSCPTNADVATTWPMDWYLAIGSGPYNNSAANPTGIQNAMLGKSDQEARVYLLEMGGTGGTAQAYVSNSTWALHPPHLPPFGYPKILPAGTFPKSFFSDLISVDYDLDFKTDVMYFGSIADTLSSPISYKGGMHRLVTSGSLTPSTWTLNTLFNAYRPVSASATASWDGSRAWVYFGTGRLLNAFEDKTDNSQQTYYGLKESYTIVGGKDKMDLTLSNGGNLVDVSKVWVESGTGNLYGFTTDALGNKTFNITPAVVKSTNNTTLAAKTFAQLNTEMSDRLVSGLDKYHGWKLDFPRPKERNLGQAALLGEILTFTTYMPSSDICTAEGESVIWAPYYRTGTAYFKPVLGLADHGGKMEATRESTPVKGMTLTPSLHSGAESGTKALIQTSTGAIVSIDQAAPGTVKSGITSWRDKGGE